LLAKLAKPNLRSFEIHDPRLYWCPYLLLYSEIASIVKPSRFFGTDCGHCTIFTLQFAQNIDKRAIISLNIQIYPEKSCNARVLCQTAGDFQQSLDSNAHVERTLNQQSPPSNIKHQQQQAFSRQPDRVTDEAAAHTARMPLHFPAVSPSLSSNGDYDPAFLFAFH